MLSKQQKKDIVKNLTEDLKRAKSVVFSDYQNLKAADAQKLRADLRQQGVAHKVIKITLLKKALERAGIDTADFSFQKPLAVTYSPEDEAAPARVLSAFAKANSGLELLGGVFGGQLVGLGEVNALASLPSKQELRGRVVGAIAGPLRGLVGALSGNLRQVVYVLKAIEEVKSK